MAESTGALTEAVFYILLSLHTRMHGYGIMQNVAKLSNGRVRLGAGTLYGALNTLVEKGWILPCGSGGTRKKEYEITELGKTVIQAEVKRLKELVYNGENVIKGALL